MGRPARVTSRMAGRYVHPHVSEDVPVIARDRVHTPRLAGTRPHTAAAPGAHTASGRHTPPHRRRTRCTHRIWPAHDPAPSPHRVYTPHLAGTRPRTAAAPGAYTASGRHTTPRRRRTRCIHRVWPAEGAQKKKVAGPEPVARAPQPVVLWCCVV